MTLEELLRAAELACVDPYSSGPPPDRDALRMVVAQAVTPELIVALIRRYEADNWGEAQRILATPMQRGFIS